MNHILTKTFESEFNEDNYKDLVVNLFNRFDFSKECSLKQHFTDEEKQKINDFTFLGTYEDTEKKSLDVLIVELKGGSKVERARSLQRNLIGKYLKGNFKDSALVAFYSKDNPDWRLSFVKMEYRLDEKGAKAVVGTPPKRYSFLVGKTEPSHTAKKQMLPLLDDKVRPAVEEIEKAFSVEKVTKEFYIEIAKKFTELVGGERKLGSKKMVEKGCLKLPSTDDDTIKKEFAVRLIGRLLFCWFLKKKKSKGGVPLLKDKIISSDAVDQVSGYYHNMLERLFFQVLNTPAEKRIKEASHDYWLQVPFLNGGLFEPHLKDFYEVDALWKSKHQNTLKVPDEWLKKLFEIFELFNFTIDESTTVDVDISVDPEMLGRIFENLLAEINPETGETARKSTGSYYTPRPIVEYMVDESLKQYLKTELASNNVSPARSPVIPAKAGIQVENGCPITTSGMTNTRDSGQAGMTEEIDAKLAKLLSYSDDPIGLTEPETDAIIDALDKVKIIDPACGSGAFPMGILHKMLLMLQKIDPESKKWVEKKLSRIENKLLRQEMGAELRRKNWDYIHKLGIIQNSIYGIDIQPIAVEISKLRFFLSLVVDEKIDDNKPNRGVVPLPNLEFKFVAANSLIGLPHMSRLSQMEIFEARADIEKLKELRDAYFTSYGDDKKSIEHEFQKIQDKMQEYARKEMATHKKTLETQTLKLSQWNPFEDKASSWFDPEWMFGINNPSPLAGEGKGEGGFDIVIGNPPYMQLQKLKGTPLQKAYKSQNYKVHDSSGDIYCLFYEKGFQTLREKGTLCFITSNKWMRAGYGEKLRSYFAEHNPLVLIDLGPGIFESATVDTNILLIQKSKNSCSLQAVSIANNDIVDLSSFVKNSAVTLAKVSKDAWFVGNDAEQKLKRKIEKISKPLKEWDVKIYFGIKTGLNEAFIINQETRDSLVAEDAKSTEILKPILRGRDIKRYGYGWAGMWLIQTGFDIDVPKLYPAIYKHLLKFEKKAQNRDDQGRNWWNLRACAYYPEFEKKKVIWKRIGSILRFGYDSEGMYGHDSTCIMTGADLKYICAFMNSQMGNRLLFDKAPKTGTGDIIVSVQALEPLLIPPITAENKTIAIKIEGLVDQILAAKKKDSNADTSALEKEIDKMAYALYGLSPEEIEIVKGKTE
jgi:type I restriction-modification system DNA methylase subunit